MKAACSSLSLPLSRIWFVLWMVNLTSVVKSHWTTTAEWHCASLPSSELKDVSQTTSRDSLLSLTELDRVHQLTLLTQPTSKMILTTRSKPFRLCSMTVSASVTRSRLKSAWRSTISCKAKSARKKTSWRASTTKLQRLPAKMLAWIARFPTWHSRLATMRPTKTISIEQHLINWKGTSASARSWRKTCWQAR